MVITTQIKWDYPVHYYKNKMAAHAGQPTPWTLGLAGDFSLQWRHNGRDGVSNHQPHNCVLDQADIKENIKALCHWPLWGEFTGDQWIPRTKGQLHRKCFHLMMSSCFCQPSWWRIWHITWHGLTLIPAWISNYIQSKMWDKITHPFLNFNGTTVEVWQWISNFISHFTVITYPSWD